MQLQNKVIDYLNMRIILCDIILSNMKKIFLSTRNNRALESLLAERGLSAIALGCPPALEDFDMSINREKRGESRYLVAELSDETLDSFQPVIHALPDDVYPLCISENPTGKIKSFLLRRGIPDLFPGFDPERIISFLEAIESSPETKQKRMAVVNDDPSVKGVLSRLLTRFDVEPLFFPEIDGLFEHLDDDSLEMILINLGTENLNVGKLIKSSYIDRQVRKIPIITFKEMDVGIFVHELISGLNRITKVILSREELYSFLVDILYRNMIIPVVRELNGLVDFEENVCYSASSLMQIYNMSGEEIFEMDNLLSENRTRGIRALLDKLKRVMILSESLKWLKVESRKGINTCGVSGKS